mmetsp:Transcript_34166/g.102197  ORF Transcript_34166/g.102197 Transcript_34166/m.102197 type:complete len:83 (-) Transcript_34166:100-348(-)
MESHLDLHLGLRSAPLMQPMKELVMGCHWATHWVHPLEDCSALPMEIDWGACWAQQMDRLTVSGLEEQWVTHLDFQKAPCLE